MNKKGVKKMGKRNREDVGKIEYMFNGCCGSYSPIDLLESVVREFAEEFNRKDKTYGEYWITILGETESDDICVMSCIEGKLEINRQFFQDKYKEEIVKALAPENLDIDTLWDMKNSIAYVPEWDFEMRANTLLELIKLDGVPADFLIDWKEFKTQLKNLIEFLGNLENYVLGIGELED